MPVKHCTAFIFFSDVDITRRALSALSSAWIFLFLSVNVIKIVNDSENCQCNLWLCSSWKHQCLMQQLAG